MSKAAFSVFVFSIYLFLLGLILLIVPNALLLPFGFPETTDVWVRVVGMLVLILGLYYSTSARNELTPMLRATVYARLSVLLFFIAFVALGQTVGRLERERPPAVYELPDAVDWIADRLPDEVTARVSYHDVARVLA